MNYKPNTHGPSLLLKSIVTGFLILAMLIPAFYVQGLVEERKERQEEVVQEVSSSWASAQTISGPFLLVPYSIQQKVSDKETATITRHLLILPDVLDVHGEVAPEIKRRSIYKVALYRTGLQMTGQFDLAGVQPAAGETLHWDKVRFCLGVTDTRGIEKQMAGSILGTPLSFEAGIPDNALSKTGASAQADLSAADRQLKIPFQCPLNLKGSQTLQWLPLGKTTSIKLSSPWPSPSFSGKFLPAHDTRPDGFNANWQVLHFNRDFPQVWKSEKFNAQDYAFGLSLLQPADNYGKTMRTTKYAILFIGLTFGFFFLLEVLQGRRVHPVQYVLVGLALVVFYTLLLSIGEVMAFNSAYLLSALATVSLVTLYGKHLFQLWKNAWLLGGFLAGLYGFIYVLIQLEDTSLLAGSIGLFLLVALAMQLSRKVPWYPAPAAPLETEAVLETPPPA